MNLATQEALQHVLEQMGKDERRLQRQREELREELDGIEASLVAIAYRREQIEADLGSG